MKKIILHFILPILIIIVGIGLIIGSFHGQTGTAAVHSSPAVSLDSSGSSADHGSDGGPSPSKTAPKKNQPGQEPSAAGSEPGQNQTRNSTVSGAVSGTAAGHDARKTDQSAAVQPPASSHASPGSSENQGTVSVAIEGLKGFNSRGSVAYQANDSAFSVLQRFARAKHIELSYYGFGSSIYVSSINHQKAGQLSSASGWMYSVNGKTPNISAGAYHVQTNETINWYYSK
ncbi:DUF4430 domain-containing protein [Sporolactobacillus sp. CQH2019]|uniref:DUF4430 domain-containing protein n=1 Tax=Sporolactobacillus sp. CQH2019 TaxID=3023512 RepID=UPI002367B74C|nr:DUF4430 domain-containing protein [Sporolactobacillus sp. CQH2019]MDD9147533.1 DUF4430 domain-containing protein [Sporolactobacillus sp. CQH2019]